MQPTKTMHPDYPIPFLRTVERPGRREMFAILSEIIAQQRLSALFQPIVDMQRGEIMGYEGLIRGPSDTSLHSPVELFKYAEFCGLSVQIEHLCRRVVIQEFVRQGIEGRLFLNVSPRTLTQPDSPHGETMGYLRENGLASDRVVIELTESHPGDDYELIGQATSHYRSMGFRIAIDDLGEGFSSLRRWSELRPEFVKIDMHFVRGIDQDPVKLQFVRSIQEIARCTGTQVIAEGIETEAELGTLLTLAIPFGQGYLFARPSPISASTQKAKIGERFKGYKVPSPRRPRFATAEALAHRIPFVIQATGIDAVDSLLRERPSLPAVAVVKGRAPLGVVTRASLFTNSSAIHDSRDKASICRVMAPALMVEASTPIHSLAAQFASADSPHLADGFIVTRDGNFFGYGTCRDLMRAIIDAPIGAEGTLKRVAAESGWLSKPVINKAPVSLLSSAIPDDKKEISMQCIHVRVPRSGACCFAAENTANATLPTQRQGAINMTCPGEAEPSLRTMIEIIVSVVGVVVAFAGFFRREITFLIGA